MRRLVCVVLGMLAFACHDDSKGGSPSSTAGTSSTGGSSGSGGEGTSTAHTGSGAGPTSGGTGAMAGAGGSSTTGEAGADAVGGSHNTSTTGARHDFCADVGMHLGMGASIFGDAGTNWYERAAQSPTNIAWDYGYFYASGDPHDDSEGFAWLVNFRLDTAQGAGASVPTVTFYRMLNVGRDHGYSGSEAQVVQAMLADSDAMADYLDDFVLLLDILAERDTPTLLHVEPDSWGFMMWAFDGVDGDTGNADPSSIPVALGEQPVLAGQSFPNHAGGLGQALLALRDEHAPEVRLGWHASNFRVGTKPEVVTDFYSAMGAWDVIVTEPPHMTNEAEASWDLSDEDNQHNLDWLGRVSEATGLPILIWQTYVSEGQPYLGAWPDNRDNLLRFAERGVAAVLWDPNGNGADCGYSCAGATTLLDNLARYAAAPLPLPNAHVCRE